MRAITLLVALFGLIYVASARPQYTQFRITRYNFNRHGAGERACQGYGFFLRNENVDTCITGLVNVYPAIKIFFNSEAQDYFIQNYQDAACTVPANSPYLYNECIGNGYQGSFYSFSPVVNSSESNGCSAELSITQRAETFMSNTRMYLYDISVKNTGSLAVTAASLKLSKTGFSPSAWNFNFSNYSITGFDSIFPSSTYNGAGFIFNEPNPKFPESLVQCGDLYGSTSVSYSPAPAPVGTCSATATATARPGGTQSATIYDVIITNDGDLKIWSVSLGINDIPLNAFTSYWNMVPSPSFYRWDVNLHGDLNVGASNSGVGFILSGDYNPTFAVGYSCGN